MGDGPHMESWHVVGQKVVCVNAEPISGLTNNLAGLVSGEIYTIRRVELDANDRPGFLLAEFENDYRFFDHVRFRPVRTTSIECFRSFLTPTPEQVREMEEA